MKQRITLTGENNRILHVRSLRTFYAVISTSKSFVFPAIFNLKINHTIQLLKKKHTHSEKIKMRIDIQSG